MRLSAFPERVAPQILSLESVDFFGTREHFSTLGTKGFSRVRREFRCWPKADTSSAVGRRHEWQGQRLDRNRKLS